jgi:hypothetical protein
MGFEDYFCFDCEQAHIEDRIEKRFAQRKRDGELVLSDNALSLYVVEGHEARCALDPFSIE